MGSVQLDRQALQLQAFHLAHQEGLTLSAQVLIQLAQVLTVDLEDSRTAALIQQLAHSISTQSVEGLLLDSQSNMTMHALLARTSC